MWGQQRLAMLLEKEKDPNYDINPQTPKKGENILENALKSQNQGITPQKKGTAL